MSIDKSLKRKRGSSSSRNVLKRAERIDQMKAQETWREGQTALGLPKTRVIKITAGKKKKVKKEEEPAAGGKAAPKKK